MKRTMSILLALSLLLLLFSIPAGAESNGEDELFSVARAAFPEYASKIHMNYGSTVQSIARQSGVLTVLKRNSSMKTSRFPIRNIQTVRQSQSSQIHHTMPRTVWFRVAPAVGMLTEKSTSKQSAIMERARFGRLVWNIPPLRVANILFPIPVHCLAAPRQITSSVTQIYTVRVRHLHM